MDALKRYPRHKRRAVAREWGRRSQAVQAEAEFWADIRFANACDPESA